MFGIITLVFFALSNKHVEVEAIVDGEPAENGQFPWTIALFLNDEFLCTASLISKQTVLTAAHCVVFNDQTAQASSYYGNIGDVDRDSSAATRIDFSSVTVHPDYDSSTLTNDIAVFQTREPVELSDTIKPICIARADTPNNQYKNATAMGWGRVKTGGSLPERLMYVEQMVLGYYDCKTRLQLFYGAGDTAAKTQLCTRELKLRPNGVCNGDSGGPLVHLSGKMPPVQIGVTSYGSDTFGCGTRIIPSVSTKVSAYVSFIEEVSGGDNGICTL